MLHPQLTLSLHRELVIDNFAGGGGASTGIERALGRPVDHAINHDHLALGMHRINHPQTVHHCEDVFDVDPQAVTEGRPVGLGWFSPDCKHFSKAKGGKPLDKRIRGLVLVMLRWAKFAAPRVLMMENVEEITTWCPLKKMKKNGVLGWYPDERHKGRTWKAFLACLGKGIKASHPDLPFFLEVLGPAITKADLVRGFGYQIETRELRGCAYGAPTIRKRLFMVARRDGQPIVWPEETHADPKIYKAVAKNLHPVKKPWRTIAECIDWSLPCPSIFLTTEEAKKVRCKRPLAAPSLRRIAKGVDRYILRAAEPFLVSLTHQGGDRVEAVTEPAKTITGAHRGEKAVVAPVVVNTANSKTTGRGPNVWPAEEPLRTATASPSFNLAEATLAPVTEDPSAEGNSQDPEHQAIAQEYYERFVAPFITEHAQAANQRVMPADEPGRTQCAEVKGGHFALVSPTLINTTNGKFDEAPSRTRSVEEPVPTLTGEQKFALVAGTLVQTGYGEREGQEPRCLDAQAPLGTVVAGGCKHAVVGATLVGAGGPEYSGKPTAVDRPFKSQTAENHTAVAMVKMRGTNIGDHATAPLHTVSAGGTHHGVVAAYLAQHNGGFNEQPGHDAREPMSTVSSRGSQQQVVAAHLTKFCTGSVGGDLEEPLPTVTAGSHRPETRGGAASVHGMVSASIAVYHGTEEDGHGCDEPGHTATTRGRLGLIEAQRSAAAMLTPEELAGARRVAAFLREHGVEFEGEFAMVRTAKGNFVIVDLGMRMLTPRELFRAQGFPDDYVIDRAWLIDPLTGDITERPLTKEQQIRMCGNSVCPPVSEALVRANVPELCLGHPSIKKPARKTKAVHA